ncbi:hypothetical protein ACO1O0_007654 [Amphichorda felina]
MPGIDVPNLVHEENMANQDPAAFKPAPPYEDASNQVHVHNHYVQAPVEAPTAKLWYCRKTWIYTIIGLIVMLVVVGLSAGLAVFAIRMRHNDDGNAAQTSTPSATPLPLSPSEYSKIAAVDVNIGRSGLHRRLVVWQDSNDALIAHNSSAHDKARVYRIGDKFNDRSGSILNAMPGTDLAATPDDQGAIHLFYVSDDGSTVIRLTQDGEGDWVSQGELVQVSRGSSLSATWHQSDKDRGVVVLAYVNPDGAVSFQISPEPGFDEWKTFEPDEFKDMSRYDGEPIPIVSHPTYLEWSRLRPGNGSSPTLDGFLALENYKSSLLYHRLIPRVPDPEPTGGTTVYYSDVETQEVIDREIDAIAVTDERALFARSGTKIFEFRLRDEEWEIWREVDTTMPDNEAEK